MREIKFRARNANLPRCWIYGYFVVEKGSCYIINDDGKFQVIAGSEGQFTGLKDKNGKDIYEGDIVNGEYIAYDVGMCCGKVLFDEARFIFSARIQPKYPNTPIWIPLCEVKNIEVIGNIYENPELLGDLK